MKQYTFIGIDPGHTAWAIAYRKSDNSEMYEGIDPRYYTFIIGSEKLNTLGCPEIITGLNKVIADEGEYIVIVEEPMTNPKLMRPVVSLNRDIGYIKKFCDDKGITMIPCQASDWKKFLEYKSLLPSKSGNIKPGNYCPILNKHFDLNLNPDQWAAWAMCWWAEENIERTE